MTALALNDCFVAVPTPAKALVLDLEVAVGRLVRDLAGPYATPHGHRDAFKQLSEIRRLAIEAAFELGEQQ